MDQELANRVLNMSHADLQMEVVRLTAVLHANRRHPDWLYTVAPTHSPLSRQWWQDAGWEPNPEYPCAPGDECWRRRKDGAT